MKPIVVICLAAVDTDMITDISVKSVLVIINVGSFLCNIRGFSLSSEDTNRTPIGDHLAACLDPLVVPLKLWVFCLSKQSLLLFHHFLCPITHQGCNFSSIFHQFHQLIKKKSRLLFLVWSSAKFFNTCKRKAE